MNEKFIGYFRLIDACDRDGCPVSRSVEEDGRRHLDALMYEQVTDAATRHRLRASWGFCNWHTWMLLEVPSAASGAAITISALFGLSHGIITPAQYSHLVASVIGSAVIPTLIANAFFMPVHLRPSEVGQTEPAPAAAELYSISIEEHLPHYAASISEVKAAKEQIDEYFGTLTKQARDQAALAGVELETVIRQGHEVETIVTMAKEGKFDLLVIGYHGHSGIFGRSHLGSTAQSIVRLAPCPVLLAK